MGAPPPKPKPPTAVKPMSPDDPVMYLRRVGPKNAALFEKMGVRTLRDLLLSRAPSPRRLLALAPLGSNSAETS